MIIEDGMYEMVNILVENNNFYVYVVSVLRKMLKVCIVFLKEVENYV